MFVRVGTDRVEIAPTGVRHALQFTAFAGSLGKAACNWLTNAFRYPAGASAARRRIQTFAFDCAVSARDEMGPRVAVATLAERIGRQCAARRNAADTDV